MIKKSNWELYLSIFIVSILFVFFAKAEEADTLSYEIGEPTYSLIDANNVNVASGNLYYHLNDISIGAGANTLSHSISINARDAVQLGGHSEGYKDKYSGGLVRTMHSKSKNSSSNFYAIQVSDDVGTYQFVISNTGQFLNMGNGLETLEVLANQYILTRKDGVKVYFEPNRAIPNPLTPSYFAYGSMVKIEYPSGFTINIHKSSIAISGKIMSVTSNNGLQLKYIYEPHSRPLASEKLSATSNPLLLANSARWSAEHPSKIIALNNAIETCPLMDETCSPQGEWPEVRYLWPDGMPRAMYIGESAFTVEDAYGKNTTFHHTAMDSAEGFSSSPHGEYYFPRITRVTTNQGLDISYNYRNDWTVTSVNQTYVRINAGPQGTLVNSTNNETTQSYNFSGGGSQFTQNQDDRRFSVGGGYKSINSVSKTTLPMSGIDGNTLEGIAYINMPLEVDLWNQTIYLERNLDNRVSSVKNKLDGTTTFFEYDGLGRLKRRDKDGLFQTINYPYSNTVCDNYKFCHKPVSVSNHYSVGLGETPIYTYYDYHANSGQVASVTHPASQGKIAKTVYTYQQYYARYINDVGTLATSSSPIWLLSSKFFCKNSNVTSNNTACESADKITTTYNYGSGTAGNNLFLIGTSLTTEGDSKIYNTCYKYDKYGNQIGETQPKAGIADCNVGREY